MKTCKINIVEREIKYHRIMVEMIMLVDIYKRGLMTERIEVEPKLKDIQEKLNEYFGDKTKIV